MQHRRRLNVFRAMQKAQREESLHTDRSVREGRAAAQPTQLSRQPPAFLKLNKTALNKEHTRY